MSEPAKDFTASLSARAKLVTYGVGFGVGLGVPSILGIAFAAAFGTPVPLLLPAACGLGLFLSWWCRTVGYRVDADAIAILQPGGPVTIAVSDVESASFPAPHPPGAVFGLWRVDGIFGRQGTFWNRAWGKFRVYVTNERNTVEIRLRSGRRVLLSPDDPERFVDAVRAVLPA